MSQSIIQNPTVSAKIITYSPAYTIVPTYECFNRCDYCNFRTNPHQSPWLDLETAAERLSKLQDSPVVEILILSGEIHPLSPRRQLWIKRVYDLAQLALSMGFLPHTNIGPLMFAEMMLLKEVNVSMGLMLEQLNPHLLQTVHRHAPTKNPQLRLQQLEWAGKLKIPFTTGILLGIGETLPDIIDSLEAIAEIQNRWGHIQEVILQPYSAGTKDKFQGKLIDNQLMIDIVILARKLLPESIKIQIPPNLVSDQALLLQCIQLGARDLGGIVPKDEVNPDYHHDLSNLRQIVELNDYQLIPRLPVYPQYYSWLPTSLQEKVEEKINSLKLTIENSKR